MNNYIFDKIEYMMEENNLNDLEIKKLVSNLKELDAKYQTEIHNRLEIIELIRQNINNLYKKSKLLDPVLFELERFYSYRDKYIDNYDKVMNLILNLANQKEEKYTLKQVFATETPNPDDENGIWYGKTLLILDKKVAKVLFDQNYRSEVLGRMIKSIIDCGYSVVLITQNFCDGRVRPSANMFDNIKYKRIRNGGFAGDISCYLYNDELNNVIENIIKYIDEYGPDFTNIDLDTLTELVLNYSREKILIK